MGRNEEKEELSLLLRNIHKALKLSNVKELNNAFSKLLNKKSVSTSKVDVVLKCVCEEYNISLKQLLQSTERNVTSESRPIAICLLHFNLGYTTRNIATGVFGKKYKNFVLDALKRHKNLDANIKQDREYKMRYDKIETAIRTKLNK